MIKGSSSTTRSIPLLRQRTTCVCSGRPVPAHTHAGQGGLLTMPPHNRCLSTSTCGLTGSHKKPTKRPLRQSPTQTGKSHRDETPDVQDLRPAVHCNMPPRIGPSRPCQPPPPRVEVTIAKPWPWSRIFGLRSIATPGGKGSGMPPRTGPGRPCHTPFVTDGRQMAVQVP